MEFNDWMLMFKDGNMVCNLCRSIFVHCKSKTAGSPAALAPRGPPALPWGPGPPAEEPGGGRALREGHRAAVVGHGAVSDAREAWPWGGEGGGY